MMLTWWDKNKFCLTSIHSGCFVIDIDLISCKYRQEKTSLPR